MKTASNNRTNNLNILINQYGSQRALGDAADLPPSYFSQIKTGVRNLGDKAARKIEIALGKPLGWMDQDNSSTLAYAQAVPVAEQRGMVKDFPLTPKFSDEVQVVVDELIKNSHLINIDVADEIVDFIKFKIYQNHSQSPTEYAVMSMVERLYKSAILGMSAERRQQLNFNDKLQIIMEIFHEQYGALSTETENQIVSVLKQIE